MKNKVEEQHMPAKHNIQIKRTKDNVYDVYVDSKWLFSRGHYENVLDELKKLFMIFEGE